jgi:FkbM family methyltransferase
MKPYDLLACMWVRFPVSLRSVYQKVSGNHSFASLVLPNRIETAEIKGGIGKGMKMRLNLQTERCFFLGTHEEEVQGCLLKQVKEGMTVYNVGAHIGFFTLGLGHRVGNKGRVVAFEPNPEVRKRLIEHISLNGINERVHVEECALSDVDGHAEFSMALSNTQGRFADLPYVKPGLVIQVSCKRLDTYVREGGPMPDMVLMDVEHAEGRVLRGMDETLENRRPIIVLEMHGPDSIREAWTELKKHNYTLTNISNSRAVATVEDIAYGNYLAVHRNSLDQILS